jgi:hypothetical protein
MVEITEFWRVGFHADPLHVTLEYQTGSGRFDDPYGTAVVLYGADSVRTCLLEVTLPWHKGDDDYVSDIPSGSDPEDADDPELLAAIAQDAERDRVIASQRRRLPEILYDRAKVYARLAKPAQLADLNSPGTRLALVDAIPAVKAKLRKLRLTPAEFDKSVLLSQYVDITRAISGYLMRGELNGRKFDGMRCDSRLDGTIYILFDGRYTLQNHDTPVRLHPHDADVLKLARELGWDP